MYLELISFSFQSQTTQSVHNLYEYRFPILIMLINYNLKGLETYPFQNSKVNYFKKF